MQEAIQSEMEQEIQDRRDKPGHRDEDDDTLFENPNHSADAWRPLRRSQKALKTSALNAGAGDEAENGSVVNEDDEPDGEPLSEEEDTGEDASDSGEEDAATAAANAGRIRKVSTLR